MDEEKKIEDRHEIASIINGCLCDGYCTASHLARRITQAGYGNIKQAVKEFAEKLKSKGIFRKGENLFNERDIDNLVAELYGADE